MLATIAALVAATLVAILAVLSSPAVAPASAASCINAETPAGELDKRDLRKAITCLVNKERKKHDLAKVGRNRKLQKAAQRHTNVMVKTDCLLHQCPGEANIDRRIRKSGYLDGARSWAYAENTGCAVTARAMVARWLDSSFHRENMLGQKFRHIGVGVSDQPVAEVCKPDHSTFTAVFGWRKS
jgi:uncharacterized protein YkwD